MFLEDFVWGDTNPLIDSLAQAHFQSGPIIPQPVAFVKRVQVQGEAATINGKCWARHQAHLGASNPLYTEACNKADSFGFYTVSCRHFVSGACPLVDYPKIAIGMVKKISDVQLWAGLDRPGRLDLYLKVTSANAAEL